MFRFEDLQIWNISIDKLNEIYKTTRNFPREELFGLTSQLRRSTLSISLNIAEGSARSSNKDFQRFLSIALGSLFETVAGLKVASQLNYITDQKYRKLYNEFEILAKKISAFRKGL